MIQDMIQEVLRTEAEAIEIMRAQTGAQYDEVVQLFYHCEGKVVFMGVGKSGHIGQKLAATFSSTGTPAIFVHGTEACHGDLGMIERRDVAVLISYSGNTAEAVQNIAPLKKIGCKTVAFTAGADSALAKGCDFRLLFPRLKEADELNLAPTASSTMTLALGDAIACALSRMRGFTRDDFYRYHPNGALGASLKTELT